MVLVQPTIKSPFLVQSSGHTSICHKLIAGADPLFCVVVLLESQS